MSAPAPTERSAFRLRMALESADPDLRARALCELLVQALATDDHALVQAVDAARIPHCSPRFAHRLTALRARLGPVPDGYPAPCPRARSPLPPPPAVQTAVTGLIRWAEAVDGRHPGVLAEHGEVVTVDARRATMWIERYRHLRPLPVPYRHTCFELEVPRTLTWRTWWWGRRGPELAVPGWTASRDRLAVMFGIHAAAHLDHQALLAVHRGAGAAMRLEFGPGLLVAEAVAMTAEYSAGARDPQLWPAVRRGLVERLARLPVLADWAPAALAGSAILAEALALADGEFSSLPELAAAYTAGPVLLARRGFDHPLIPLPLAHALARQWIGAASISSRADRGTWSMGG